MSKAPDHHVSRHCLKFWKRLLGWYGNYLTDALGLFPAADWCSSIERLKSREHEDAVMVQLRARHTTYPPKWPEFDAIVEQVLRPPPAASAADVAAELEDFALRTGRVPGGVLITITTLHRNGLVTAIAIKPRFTEGAPVVVTVEQMRSASA